MERALDVSRAGEDQLLRAFDVLEPVLGSLPVHLVGVGVGARAGTEGDLDLLEHLLGFASRSRAYQTGRARVRRIRRVPLPPG